MRAIGSDRREHGDFPTYGTAIDLAFNLCFQRRRLIPVVVFPTEKPKVAPLTTETLIISPSLEGLDAVGPQPILWRRHGGFEKVADDEPLS
jgi:hypothetical protein